MLAVDPHPAHRNATRPGVQPFGSMLITSRIPRAHRRQILRLSKRIVPAPEIGRIETIAELNSNENGADRKPKPATLV